MPAPLADEQWRRILEIAHAAADLPKAERLSFVEASCPDSHMIDWIMELAEEFDLPVEQPELDVGSEIEHFTITGRIGRGGMGEVFAARDTELERPVAIKVLAPETVAVSGSANRIIREARTASALNHPNIVTVYEVIKRNASVAIVMELVPGSALRTLVGTEVSLDQFFQIAGQIASALEAAHAAGIVHRDIKPENVIVRPDGQVKVLDFGLARSVDGTTPGASGSTSGLFAGSPRYMPPESCKGASCTTASDIFPLGVTFYELLTGQHPFAAPSSFETMQAIVNKAPAPPVTLNHSVPKALNQLIVAMMAKRPEDRPSAAELTRSLEDIKRGRQDAGSRTQSGTWLGTKAPLPRLRRAAAWVAGTLALAAIGGIVWWKLRPAERHFVEAHQITSLLPENRATASAISGDGKFLAYANEDGLFLRTMQNWETQELKAPDNFIVDRLAWYPDGARLAVSGFSSTRQQPSVWVVSVTGAAPRMLCENARQGVPSPDGARLAFLSADSSEIWVGGADAERPLKVTAGPGSDTFSFIYWSSSGRSVLFQRRHYSNRDLGFVMLDRYYERSLESVDIHTQKILSVMRDCWIDSAVSLLDGRMLLLRFGEPGTEYFNEIWEVPTDVDSGTFRGSLHRLTTVAAIPGGFVKALTATTDGTQVSVLRSSSEMAVYVADYASSPPKFSNSVRLTLDTRMSFPHAWTADSSAVIFESDRNGSWDIFRQRPGQRTPETVIANRLRAEVLPQLTPDGRSILYASGPMNSTGNLDTLMHIPVEGGTPTETPNSGLTGEFRCSVNPGGRCVFRRAIGRQFYVFHELDPIRGVGQELARTEWLVSVVGDWDISPDGSYVAIPNHDLRSAKVRIVALDSSKPGPREREITVAGYANIAGLTSAVDGSGWFISVLTTVGGRLVYLYSDGRVHPIGNIQGWVVPAPNGRRVAYMNSLTAANAWTMEFQ